MTSALAEGGAGPELAAAVRGRGTRKSAAAAEAGPGTEQEPWRKDVWIGGGTQVGLNPEGFLQSQTSLNLLQSHPS